MSGAAATEPARRAPHPRLRGLVTTYQGYRHDALPVRVHHGLPSAELTVVLAIDEPLDVGWLGDEASRNRHRVLASGLHLRPAAIHQDGPQEGVQLGLTPLGARALLGVPAGALAGTLVSLAELLGPAAAALYDEVVGAPTWRARFAALDRHLVALAAGAAEVRPELHRAWTRIEAARGAVRIEALARELGWSRRHLSASFTAEFGLTPKQLARVVRFQHARSRLGNGTGLAAVAFEAGYADQAHLTREWRELAGCSPTAWLREEFPFLQEHAPAQ
jgi:AraC-like DNA-binding protein